MDKKRFSIHSEDSSASQQVAKRIATASPPLEVFKTQLAKAQSCMNSWHHSEMDSRLGTSQGSFHPKKPMTLWNTMIFISFVDDM